MSAQAQKAADSDTEEVTSVQHSPAKQGRSTWMTGAGRQRAEEASVSSSRGFLAGLPFEALAELDLKHSW